MKRLLCFSLLCTGSVFATIIAPALPLSSSVRHSWSERFSPRDQNDTLFLCKIWLENTDGGRHGYSETWLSQGWAWRQSPCSDDSQGGGKSWPDWLRRTSFPSSEHGRDFKENWDDKRSNHKDKSNFETSKHGRKRSYEESQDKDQKSNWPGKYDQDNHSGPNNEPEWNKPDQRNKPDWRDKPDWNDKPDWQDKPDWHDKPDGHGKPDWSDEPDDCPPGPTPRPPSVPDESNTVFLLGLALMAIALASKVRTARQ